MRPRLVEVDVVATSSQLDHYGVVTAAFETYHAELYSFLRRSTRDEGAAEDLLQETFLRLTREVEGGRTPEHIRGWLYRVASNLAISRGRRRMTAFDWMNRYGRTERGDDVESPESGVLARERTSAIDAVLATLPVDARTALLLSADGFSGEEIAATIGRTHAATRTLICRARVRVRLELERTGGRAMTTVHDEFLELAAAAIDFELSRDERAALDRHLASCSACRHRVAGFAADQTAIARLPRYVLGPAAATAVRGRVIRRSSAPRPTLRLLAAAAMLALLALAALAVGAQVIRRDRDLTDVAPSIAPSPGVPALPAGILAAGSTVDVVSSGLRVRTAPTVDDSKSAKLEPLLSRGVQLQILDGPVTADDYDWYHVQAIGWPHRGWVAAADHDGVAWIEDRSASSAKPATFTAVEAALVSGLRKDAAIGCTPRRTNLPPRAIAGVDCRVNGAVVTRVGAYRFAEARDAATTYLERLASYSVKAGTGDCPSGKSGDAAWMPGDRKAGTETDRVYVGGTGPWVVGRIGCFLDENGTANVRLTCGTTYVGILGRDADLADLDRFALASATGPTKPGQAPGICQTGG